MKSIILIISLLWVWGAEAQFYQVEYSSRNKPKDLSKIPIEHQKDLRKARSRIRYYQLNISNTKSSYLPMYSTLDGQQSHDLVWFLGGFDVYKDFASSSVYQFADFLGTETGIKDDISLLFDWKKQLNKDTVIYGFDCFFASATINGYDVNVWYAPNIPVMDGPWMYCGLPGLILRVETPSRIIEVSKLEILIDSKNEIEIPKRNKYKTFKQYLATRNESQILNLLMKNADK